MAYRPPRRPSYLGLHQKCRDQSPLFFFCSSSPPSTPATPSSLPPTETAGTAVVPVTTVPQAKGWWEEAAHTTRAWAKLVEALGLTDEQTASLLAAPPVKDALWAYDERFLQPHLGGVATTDGATTTARRPRSSRPLSSSSHELVRHVIPVGASAYTNADVRALWEDFFRESANKVRNDPRYPGDCHHVHASLAAWRILLWLQTEEAAALGLGELYIEERAPHNWGTAVQVVGVLLEYLYDFEGETRV
ncbi:hypothetical protein PG994_001736 [Apiospora phragmitis]|uniref:Uncharacterized protein n=1 Tax=Apiospora phragmitis TaxID=2905665 RepID=A0ABR1WUJ1_9PEZI